MFFQAQGRVGTGQLAAHHRHFLLPGEGDQVNLLQIPGVVLLPHAGGSVPGGEFLLQPALEFGGGLPGLVNGRDQFIQTGHAGPQGLQVGNLGLHGPDTTHPESSGVLNQIRACLVEQTGDGLDTCRQFPGIAFVQRMRIGPDFDRWIGIGAFVGGNIAASGMNEPVKGRISGPGPADPVIECQAVHLGPDQAIVHLSGDRPAAGVDSVESPPVNAQFLVLGGHGRGRVIGHPSNHPRLFKTTPLFEECQQILVTTGARGVLLRGTRRTTTSSGTEEHQRQADLHLQGKEVRHSWPSLQ